MSALVKLATDRRMASYIKAKLHDGIDKRATDTSLGIELFGEPKIVVLGGEKDGQEIRDGIVKPNQKVVVTVGSMNPHKYQVIQQPHYDLVMNGEVRHNQFMEPGDEVAIGFVFKADRQIDMNSLPWLVRLYMLD